MKIEELPQRDFRRTPWKNGGGVTLDIAAAWRAGANPASWSGMLWRFGRTTIAEPGAFSDLAGYERLQAVVAGGGLVLESPEGEIDLRQRFAVVRYDGALPIRSRLESGPVEVVNLIADRALFAIGLAVLHDGDSAPRAAGRHIAYAPAGTAAVAIGAEPARAVAGGDALSLEADAPLTIRCERGPALLASILPRGGAL